jgi:glycosyltransferase involved in cell wall biosynthesis
MRILYHHRTLADGAEGIHIAEMVAAFRELGHEVQVLGLAAGDRASQRRGLIAGLRDALPQWLFELASTAGNVVEYLDVRRAIGRFTPHLLYKRHGRNDVGALLAARRAGVPAVLEVNCLFTGTGYRDYEPVALERVAAALEDRALKLATHRLAVSTPLARQIDARTGAGTVVVPNGADPCRFDPSKADTRSVRARLGWESAFVVGWSGVLREWHGLELLLDAAARVPECRLLIVGDGPARATVEARALSLGLAGRVAVTGRLAHEAMPDHVAAMDVAVVAHDGTGVASPMKLLEYMAMARPVVAPRLDNIRDVVDDGRTGLLFPPGDAAGLAAALERLRADPGLRARLGGEARAAVVSTRNWEANARRVLQLVGAQGLR